jgi:hypothetical protein
MSLWSKIDNFFAPNPTRTKGAAAAAAAAADIPLYALNLITRPDSAKDLVKRVETVQKLPSFEQEERMIDLYLDIESFLIENDPVKNYTKQGLRQRVFIDLKLKQSPLHYTGFFQTGLEGGFSLMQDLFSRLARPAFDVLGEKRVGQIVLSVLDGTIFEGVSYKAGLMDFSTIRAKLKNDATTEKEFKKVFSEMNEKVAGPVKALHGKTPQPYFVRKRIIDEWQLLHEISKPAWQELKSTIDVTSQAREMLTSVGMGELITRGTIAGVETELMSKSGKAKAVSVSASALKDEAGNIQGMVISAKDLSEIQRLEAEKVRILEHAKEEAEAEVAQRTAELEKSKKDLQRSLATEQASTQQLKASEQQQKAANQQLNAANQQLAASQTNLQDKLLELERFNKVAVGRELRMVELKEEIARLKVGGE